MNYLIINGKNSNELQGFLVQKLAPISKPPKRYKSTTIDGKDGDICSVLGYSAYDKEITIGLSYNYDIDDVIKFFDTEGEITFSNELDKKYRFAIYEQIDFNKLIRFKEATIRLHCQPFKYSAVEKAKTYTSSTFKIMNNGNTTSKPRITITGSGTATINLEGSQVLSINMATTSQVIIDVEKLEALKSDNTLANRLCVGDYEDLTLKAGANNFTTSNITSITFENYSRWI